MTAAMIISGVFFVALCIVALNNGVGEGVLLSSKPFFNPETFKPDLLMAGTAIGLFSYIGFDGVSTLAEEVENPRVNLRPGDCPGLRFLRRHFRDPGLSRANGLA